MSVEGTTAPATWQDVPPQEVHGYLGMFSARGQGWVRDADLASTTVSTDADHDVRQVTVEVVDSRHGRWRVTFADMQVHDTVGLFDDDPPWQVALDTINHGTWEVHDSTGCHYGTGIPVFGARPTGDQLRDARQAGAAHLSRDTSGRLYAVNGAAKAVLTFTAARLQRQVLQSAPGACVACGGTQFRLSALASVGVHLVHDTDGAARYVADARTVQDLAGDTVLRNTFSSLVCASCHTKQTRGLSSLLQAELGAPGTGASWQRNRGASLRLPGLLDVPAADQPAAERP